MAQSSVPSRRRDRFPIARSFILAGASIGVLAATACSGPSSSADHGSVQAERPALGEPGSRYAVVAGEVVPVPDIPMGDERTIRAILEEGKNRNAVMDHLRHLCVTVGPRLTASTALEETNLWAAERLTEWGLVNVENRVWEEATLRFDRGPSSGRVLARDAEGDEATFNEVRGLEFTTLSWAPGTDGPVRGRVVKMPTTLDELEAAAGSFEGAWVLHSPYQGGRQGIRGIGRAMAARHLLKAEIRQMVVSGQAPTFTSDPSYRDDGVSGTWLGTASGPAVPNGRQVFQMNVRLADDGGVTGSVGMPGLGFMSGMVDPAYEDGILSFVWRTPVGDRPLEFPLIDGSTRIERLEESDEAVYVFQAELQPPEVDPAKLEKYIMHAILLEGPAGFVSSSQDERVWTTSVKRGQDLLRLTREDVGQDVEVNIRDSDYRWINSDLADGQGVYLEFDLDHTFEDGPIPLYNTIAEIPGTERPDEVVIVSAHVDSWNGPGSQGTLDNGTGTAVTLEAARILAAVGARPKRTIRFILWTGEEQGLLGARAYVASLSDEERARISATFVDDGGTNYEGGIPAADVMVDYLAAATAPTNGQFFSEIDRGVLLADDNPDNDDRAGWLDVNIRPTGATINTHSGSDHAAFNEVGIPGFFWDEVGRSDYRFGWHTQNDRIELAIEEYLIQSATNAAITAYNLACAPELLPRGGEGALAAND
ncbi:MAG: M20/M25/M40 family metallo-hydrolase [Planctomycetota bacterium]